MRLLTWTLCMSLSLTAAVPVRAASIAVPAETRILLATEDYISGKKKDTAAGQTIRCRVWRDVVVDGHLVVRAGETVAATVEQFKKARVFGRKGSIQLGVQDVPAYDGAALAVNGGLGKEGKGRIAMSATLTALVAWPLLFIKGAKPEIPAGTVFDVFTENRVTVEVDEASKREPAPDTSPVRIVFDYSSLEVEKPKLFRLIATGDLNGGETFAITTINEQAIKALSLQPVVLGDETRLEGELKPLAKQFAKGINRFEVVTRRNGERIDTDEIVMEIQF